MLLLQISYERLKIELVSVTSRNRENFWLYNMDHIIWSMSFRKFVRENFDKIKDTIQVPNNTTNVGEVRSYPLIHFKMPYKNVKLWGQRLSCIVFTVSLLR